MPTLERRRYRQRSLQVRAIVDSFERIQIQIQIRIHPTTTTGYVSEWRSSGGGEWGECPCRAQFASTPRPTTRKSGPEALAVFEHGRVEWRRALPGATHRGRVWEPFQGSH